MEKTESLTEVIRYISWREEMLSNYSDKLRQSVQRIFDVFGDPEECQVCSCWNSDAQTQHFPYTTYSTLNFDEHGITEEQKNELIASGKYFFALQKGQKYNEKQQIRIWQNKDWHVFTSKIRLSLDIDGPTYSRDEWRDKERKLASRHGTLVVLEYVNSFAEENIYHPNQISRNELKQIVREKRITEFLQLYKQKLEQTTKEYQEVSSLAERLAQAVG